MTVPLAAPPTRKRGFKHYTSIGKLLVDTESLFNGRHCWIWLGYQHKAGYGVISRQVPKTRSNPRGWSACTAQRFFYELYRGPAGVLEVCHECNRRLCVNPYHMRLDTRQGNIGDWHKDYHISTDDARRIAALMTAGYPTSYIADKFMLPRLVVRRTVAEIDWRNQLNVFDPPDDNPPF